MLLCKNIVCVSFAVNLYATHPPSAALLFNCENTFPTFVISTLFPPKISILPKSLPILAKCCSDIGRGSPGAHCYKQLLA